MKRDAITLTLREACAARGLDATKYKTPSTAWRNVQRIIPGVADNESPDRSSAKHLGANYHGNARRQYTRQSAANDAGIIADAAAKGEATLAYVAAFCRLNNLTN